MTDDAIAIAPYLSLADRPGLAAELDAIFFEASATRSFDSEKTRQEFRWRWLGRFLDDHPRYAFVAHDASQRLAGYIVGSPIDPARPLDPELPFYARFAEQTCTFPAHLHINLAPRYRSKGIGARLIEAFGHNAARNGARGMHLVTSRGERNIVFYTRCGFVEVAATSWNGRELVLLAKSLAPNG